MIMLQGTSTYLWLWHNKVIDGWFRMQCLLQWLRSFWNTAISNAIHTHTQTN